MFRGAKCILNGYSVVPTASGGIALQLNVSVWEGAMLPDDLKVTMQFVISDIEAAELAEALLSAARTAADD